MSEDRTRYCLKSPTTTITVAVKEIGYGRRIVTGTDEVAKEFVGQDFGKLLDWMKKQGQVEMIEI